MVLSSCCSSIARVHPGSRGERSTAPGGRRPLDQADHKPACRLPVNYTHHRHFIITQPES